MSFSYGTVTNCKVRNGQTRSEYQCRLGYEVTGQSIENNTSTVKLILECRSISSSYNTKGTGLTSEIDGTTVKSNAAVDMSHTNTWQNFGERTITVSHNNNGSYSASKSGSFTCTAGSSNYSLRSGSASVTVAPKTIPRYATANQSLNKRTSSSIIMNWSSDSTIDYIWYSTNNGSSWTGVDVTDGTSGTYTISGLAANTTYNVKTRVRRKDSQLTTDSTTLAVTTYQKTIPTIALSSRTENTIIVTSGANVEVNSTQYRIKPANGNYGNYQNSGTFSGLTANTSYVVEVKKVGSISGESGTATISVTTYDYPHITKVGTTNLIIGNSQTLTLYNPLSRSVTIRMNKDSASGTQLYSGTTTGTSITFTPASNTLYSTIPNSTSGKAVYSAIYSNITKTTSSTYTYSTKGTEKPTFTNFTYEDTNTTTKALTGNNQILVNGYSNLKVTIPVANKAVANNSATMKSYRLNVGNMTSVSANYSSTAAVAMSINAINSPSIIVTAIDSRNYSQDVSKTAAFKSYNKPIINSMAVSRKDEVGSEVTLSFQGTWWNENFGSVVNTIKNIQYYYKLTTSSTWIKGNTQITATTNGNTFYGNLVIKGPNATDNGFDVASAYNIKMSVTDALSTSTEYEVTLGSGTPAIAIFESNVAIGQMYDESDTESKLQVNGDIKVNKGIKWQEVGYGDKFYIVPNFSGTDDNNKLLIKGAVGGTGTNPDLYDIMTISAKSGNVWAKGYIDINGQGYKQFGNTILRNNNSGITVLSGTGEGIYLRPKGDADTSGEININPNGNITLHNYVEMLKSSGDTGYYAKRTDTDTQVWMGVGSGGINHGLYSNKLNEWLIHADAEHAFFNGVMWDMSTENKTDTWVPVLASGKLQHRVINKDINNVVPVVAYSNGSGTSGTVTLSESADDYTHIRITYKNDDGQFGSIEKVGISNATGTIYGTIIRKNSDNTSIMINSALFNVSSSTITISRNSQANINFGGSSNNDTNKLSIIKVEMWN